MPRRSLTQRERFEILKRDGFACQYCGRRAPEVVLHIDHIEPLSKGGADDESNYITSCGPCNLAKADRPLLPVAPCEFCWGDGPGIFAQVPDRVKNPMGSRSTFVCNACVRNAIWQHWYSCHPLHVRCAGCGEFFPAPDDLERYEKTPPVVHMGELCWICEPCLPEELRR